MAVPVVESKTLSTGTGSVLTINMPATRPDGDLYIGIFGTDGQNNVWKSNDYPSHWVKLSSPAAAQGCDMLCFKWIGASEPATYTMEPDGEEWWGVIYRITGGDFSGVQESLTNGAGANQAAQSLNTTADETLIIRAITVDLREVTATPSTEDFKGLSNSGVGYGCAHHTGPNPAGATGTATFTHASDGAWRATLAIPAAAGGAHELEADDVESAASAGSPAFTQTHNLTVTDAQSAAGVDSPALTQTHQLAADDVQSAASVDSPTLAQATPLVADDAQSAAGVDSPALTQTQQLAAEDVQSAADVDSPALTQTHQLVADDAQSATDVDSPTLTQAHQLAADDTQSIVSVDSPALTQTHQLVADDAESAANVDSPTLTQTHQLVADDAESAAGVDSPTLSIGSIFLTPDDVESTAGVDSPALTQTHQLVADDVESASSVGQADISGGVSSTIGINFTKTTAAPAAIKHGITSNTIVFTATGHGVKLGEQSAIAGIDFGCPKAIGHRVDGEFASAYAYMKFWPSHRCASRLVANIPGNILENLDNWGDIENQPFSWDNPIWDSSFVKHFGSCAHITFGVSVAVPGDISQGSSGVIIISMV